VASSGAMQIAPLSPARYEAAVALWREAGLTRPWNDPIDDLQRAAAQSGSTVLAATEGDRLLATAMVGHDGHRGWVYYVAVTPVARGRGLGRAIMQACEHWLAQRGVPKLNLMVRGDNAAAIAFYASLGYRQDDVVVLAKRLEGDER
jgi:ribosomal protein S18 acetylase RimI-like enzyme